VRCAAAKLYLDRQLPLSPRQQCRSHRQPTLAPPTNLACSLPGQWVLEEQSGRPRFVGQPEGGQRDTGAGYFLLMKVRLGCCCCMWVGWLKRWDA
jgi:hypothetical protein